LLFGVLLDSFDHIEPHLHLGHAALVDLPALEDLLGDFDVVFHLLEGVLIPVGSFVLDFVHLEFLLSICFLIDVLELSVFESSDGELELLHAGLEDLVGVRDVMVHPMI
jgi:hypothetical protein